MTSLKLYLNYNNSWINVNLLPWYKETLGNATIFSKTTLMLLGKTHNYVTNSMFNFLGGKV